MTKTTARLEMAESLLDLADELEAYNIHNDRPAGSALLRLLVKDLHIGAGVLRKV